MVHLFRFISFVVAYFVLSAGIVGAEPVPSLPDTLSISIETALQSGTGVVVDDLATLRAFYGARLNRPAWYDARGLTADGKLAVAAIAASSDEGLDPAAYKLGNLSKPLSGTDPQMIAHRDFELTTQLLHYASDLRSGRPNLKHLDSDVDLPRDSFDKGSVLAQALDRQNLKGFLQDLAPRSPAYASLRAALARYRDIAARGGWRELPVEKPYDAKSASTTSLLALQNRLAMEDAGLTMNTPPSVPDVDAALRRFQLRNGVAGDGRVGKETLALLNTSAASRAAQIAANMERLRWLPHELEKNYVEVNVPDATLHLFDNGVEILSSRVIVGRPADPTPIFRAEITDIVANPPWIVPATIARNEILPKVRRNPAYLARHDMFISNGQVQQRPGPKNALGYLKLNVTDRFAVYLHDTPSRSLFAREQRFLSHGCIRVQQITPLASYVLTGDITGGVDRLLSVIATGDTIHLPIKQPIPLYVDYFTAFPAPDGSLQFRADIYGRDSRMIAATGGEKFTQALGSIGSCRRAA